jgi:hypothetical protein
MDQTTMNPLTHLPDNAQLQAPGPRSRALLFALVFCLPLALASFDPDLGKHARFGGAAASLFAIALLLVPVWGALDWALRRQHLSLGSDGLQVTTCFYRRNLPLASLQLDKARVLNLDERIEFKPTRKTNGTSLPGIKSGWYRLGIGSKALVSIRTGHKVLWLPTDQGYDLLLEPRNAGALLDHLRQLATSGVRA